jgi:hypothetical protein
MGMSRGFFASVVISATAIFASACATHKPVHANPPAAPVAQAQPAGDAAKPPMVTENPDGTVTIQKPPTEGKKGLVIPPQVVTPTAPKKDETKPETPQPEQP